MKIGVPKEIKNNEFRVGMTPAAVREADRARAPGPHRNQWRATRSVFRMSCIPARRRNDCSEC